MMNDNMQISDFWIVTNQDGLSRHLVQVSLARIKLKQLKEMVKIQSTVHPLEWISKFAVDVYNISYKLNNSNFTEVLTPNYIFFHVFSCMQLLYFSKSATKTLACYPIQQVSPAPPPSPLRSSSLSSQLLPLNKLRFTLTLTIPFILVEVDGPKLGRLSKLFSCQWWELCNISHKGLSKRCCCYTILL